MVSVSFTIGREILQIIALLVKWLVGVATSGYDRMNLHKCEYLF